MADEPTGGVGLAPRAEEDIGDAWLCSAAEWSPGHADRCVDGLAAVFELLCATPGIARKRAEFAPPIRIHPTGPHLIVCRIAQDRFDVLRVLGGRQDWRRNLEALE